MSATQAASARPPPSHRDADSAAQQHGPMSSASTSAAEEAAQTKQTTLTTGVGLAAGLAALLGGVHFAIPSCYEGAQMSLTFV